MPQNGRKRSKRYASPVLDGGNIGAVRVEFKGWKYVVMGKRALERASFRHRGFCDKPANWNDSHRHRSNHRWNDAIGRHRRRLSCLTGVFDTKKSNIPLMKQHVVCRSPDVMGGAPVFCGTRVPVQTLLDYLEAGDSIDDFLEGFSSVTKEQVIAFLEEATDRLVESVS
jgi:uncharacterized protein (DUF433 family)